MIVNIGCINEKLSKNSSCSAVCLRAYEKAGAAFWQEAAL